MTKSTNVLHTKHKKLNKKKKKTLLLLMECCRFKTTSKQCKVSGSSMSVGPEKLAVARLASHSSEPRRSAFVKSMFWSLAG